MINKDTVKLFLLPFCFFAGIWLYIFLSTNILFSGFNYFLDDHQILINHYQNTDFYQIFIDPLTSLFSDETKTRFRPLYDILLRFFSQFYGLNPFIWYLSSLVLAIITTTNFYIFGRLLSFPILESICFALLIVFGDQASTYARFGTPETTSTFLISLSFLCCSLNVNKNSRQRFVLDFLFILFSIAASLNKEACILMLPAFAFFKVWFFSHKHKISIKQSIFLNKGTILLLMSAFVLFLTYIKLSGVTGPGYAGIDDDTFSLNKLYTFILLFIKRFWFGIIVNLIYLLLFFLFKSKNSNKLNLDPNFYILSLLIVIPQLVLYTKSGMNAHYLLPCTIGTSLLTIYPLIELRKFSKYFIILTILLTCLIFRYITYTQVYFNNLSLSLDNVQSMVKDTKSCVDKDSQMIIFGNPYFHYEVLSAYKKGIIDNIFSRDGINIDVVLATYGSLNSNLKSNAFRVEENSWIFLKPDDVESWYGNKTIDKLTKENLKNTQSLIIFGFDKFKNDFSKLTSDWFDVNQFNFKYYNKLDVGIYCRKKKQL